MSWKAKLSVPAVVVALAGLLAAAPASADLTFGQLNPPSTAGVCGPVTIAQTGVQPGTASYRWPAGYDGVITSWRTQTGPAAGSAGLVVLRPTGANNQYTVLANDGPHPVPALSAPSFGGLRIPIREGDMIALYAAGTNCVASFPLSGYAVSAFQVGLNPAVGTTITAAGFGQFTAIELRADAELDRDGDGYGDDTQDPCPANPDAHALPCVSPLPAPNDQGALHLTLSGRPVQPALRQGGVVEVVTSDRAAAVRATGSLAIAGSKRRLSLRAAGGGATAGGKIRLVLHFSARAKRQVAAALRRGKRVRARVSVAGSADGADATASQRIVIRPKQPKEGR